MDSVPSWMDGPLGPISGACGFMAFIAILGAILWVIDWAWLRLMPRWLFLRRYYALGRRLYIAGVAPTFSLCDPRETVKQLAAYEREWIRRGYVALDPNRFAPSREPQTLGQLCRRRGRGEPRIYPIATLLAEALSRQPA